MKIQIPDPSGQVQRPNKGQRKTNFFKHPGQAMAEYAIIAAFIVLAIIGVLTLFGPAIGNVFSNTVVNVLDLTPTPYSTLNAATAYAYATAVASYTPAAVNNNPNTPVP